MAKSWSGQETGYLKRYAANKTLAELAQRFEVDEDEVRSKLAELDLTTKDGEPQSGGKALSDPALKPFEKGIEALHDGDWKAARKAFETVIAESEEPDLTARARQHLRVVERRSGGDDGGEASPYMEAVLARNRGDLDGALEIAGKAKKDEDGRFAYLAAAVHALRGDEDEAVKALQEAVDADPAHRVHAFHDPDFAELRKDKDHAHLFGLD